MPDFSNRNRDPELMDDPDVKQSVLKEVLKDINRTNRMLKGNAITINGIAQLIADHPQKSYTILDMGCGDGTMLREVIKWGRSHSKSIRAIGVDLSEPGLALAKAASIDFPEIEYTRQDILALKPGELYCDILICTLTMHHFHDEQIPVFLNQFVNLAQIGIVINDLQRSPWAYRLFKVFSTIFIQTKIAKHDGLVSIESGFKKQELISFSKRLTSMEHDIKWKWAFRYVWVMQTKRLTTVYE